MMVQLLYRVPVAVVVDTATGVVERVVVLDEDVASDRDADPWDQDTCEAVAADHPAVRTAVEIAETGEWPSWESGW